MKKLLVIDGNSLANRAFYAIPMLSNSKGIITNAVYGFTNMVMGLISQERPDYLAVAFDISRKVFRHDKYADYKAQRKGMPEELRGQMDLIKDVLHGLNIPIYQLEGYEGDDVIGTMVRWAEKQNIYSIIVTGDRDSLQLINEKTAVYLTKKGISELARYDLAAFEEEYGLVPDQIRDLKGLMGDASDNIPGVPGVGEKTAMKLLHQYNTVEALYEHLEDFQGKKLGEKLTENREQAFMSKELATIHCEIPMEFCEEDLARQEVRLEELIALYKELELKSLLKNLLVNEKKNTIQNDSIGKKEVTAAQQLEKERLESHGQELLTPEELAQVLKQEAFEDMSIILTTTPGNMMVSQVTEIGLLIHKKPYLIHCQQQFAQYAMLLKPYLEDAHVLVMTDDSKKLQSHFLREHIFVESLYWDSTLIAYLLNPEAKDLSIDRLLLDYYDITLDTDNPAEHMYGRLKGIYILSNLLIEQLEKEELIELYAQVELPLSLLLAKMEQTGIKINRKFLRQMGEDLTKRIDAITAKLYEQAGETFNLNSSKQLGAILFDKMGLPVVKKTKTGYSTDAEVLDQLADEYEFVRDILTYRQMSKINSTYVEGILKLAQPDTDKVHTTFHQTITATGRLSSTEPNLQNIPIKTEEGKKIRKAFIPATPGNLLVAADYSQIELRVLAHMSQDEMLIDSFNHDEDIHARTASEVFGVPLHEVTKTQRRNAKAVNFGIVYGQTDFGLAKELGISRTEAKAYITSYFEKYHGVRTWIDQTIQTVRQTGCVTTMLGRKRIISDINSKNYNLRSFAERTAVNTPIQGTAADIIKVAMIRIQQELTQHEFSTKMLLQVHDELIFEAPPHEVAGLIVLLRESMEHAMELSVPLKIDINVGFDWYDMERV